VNDRRPDALGDANEGRLQRVGGVLRRARRRLASGRAGEDQRVNPKACAKKGKK
jgi:hypothetical protein